MGKARLEAFSDGVIAIIITLMILEIKLPHIDTNSNGNEIWHQLLGILPNMIAYALSFVMLGIYWVNHHFFFSHVQTVDTKLLWYNLHLLFWLSLVPLPTAFIAEHHKLPEATAFYGFVSFMCAFAYSLMNAYAGKVHAYVDEKGLGYNVMKSLRVNWMTLTLYLISIFAGYINVYISISILCRLWWMVMETVLEVKDNLEFLVIKNQRKPPDFWISKNGFSKSRFG